MGASQRRRSQRWNASCAARLSTWKGTSERGFTRRPAYDFETSAVPQKEHLVAKCTPSSSSSAPHFWQRTCSSSTYSAVPCSDFSHCSRSSSSTLDSSAGMSLAAPQKVQRSVAVPGANESFAPQETQGKVLMKPATSPPRRRGSDGAPDG